VLTVLICRAVNAGAALETRLNEAQRRLEAIGEELDVIEGDLVYGDEDIDILRSSDKGLLIQQARAYDAEAADAARERHHTREEQLREEFRNCWLRATFEQLYHTLSRELRDMIYNNLINNTHMLEFDDGRGQSGSSSSGMDWASMNGYGHYYTGKSVGRDTFRELLQTWYSYAYISAYYIANVDMEDFPNQDGGDWK
jgi:hypothetical protein